MVLLLCILGINVSVLCVKKPGLSIIEKDGGP